MTRMAPRPPRSASSSEVRRFRSAFWGATRQDGFSPPPPDLRSSPAWHFVARDRESFRFLSVFETPEAAGVLSLTRSRRCSHDTGCVIFGLALRSAGRDRVG